jgi:hypothetical protein
MRKPQVEQQAPFWMWAWFIAAIILVIDPLQSFLWNSAILGFLMFVAVLRRCPVSMKTLRDANRRLEQHRLDLRSRR